MTVADRARRGSEATGPVSGVVHFGGFEALRALAASMVVLHHATSIAGPQRAGRLLTLASVMDGGVALFFVLSGFLIYRPFVAALVDGRPVQSTVAFWWRRVLRIVPAYWLALSAFWALGLFDLGDLWWRYYLFLQPFDRLTALGGIVPAWSLSTEMTFYLFVPLWAGITGVVLRHRPRAVRARGVLVGTGLVWLAGPLSRWAVERWWPAERGLAFMWLPTNLDLFGAGMALAALWAWSRHAPDLRTRLERVARPVWPWWAAGAALFVLYAYRVGGVDLVTGYTGTFWHRRQFAFDLMTVLLLVPAVFGRNDPTPLRRLWSWRPLVWVGTVSYGLYLWHLDWMQRAVSSPPGAVPSWTGWRAAPAGNANLWYLLGVGFGLGLLSAAVSWYGLEKPLQRVKGLFDRSPRPVDKIDNPQG